MLSTWNEKKQAAEHKSINSCLRPVCALGGMAITTIEGTGGIKRPENKHLTFTPSSSRGASNLAVTPLQPGIKTKRSYLTLVQVERKKLGSS
ncbi:hypothetical protein V8V91_01690 [Algoriphagus halophilus]|uniref:hypothetical protein n=1 Tax=Algoriphagus halophilus TaxID=226505 RepID=UPI00358FADC5